MKKLVVILFILTLLGVAIVVYKRNETGDSEKVNLNSEYAVAMVTDYGDINDHSFNQSAYEACVDFCDKNNVEFSYYKTAEDTTQERFLSIKTAVEDGYNVIVLPGSPFSEALDIAAKTYHDIKFIFLDAELENHMDNVYSAMYREEICGYMAGYAAVHLGYDKLGFLGGISVPAVVRFGYGFIQGVEDAASELDIDVQMKYAYGNQFVGDEDITSEMDKWYADGTQVVFACGGAIYTSVAEAASKEGVNGKLIGVDVDQSAIIDGEYGEGITVTSAMKGLYPTIYDTLEDIILHNNWSNYSGKVSKLGLVSPDKPELNYVQLPLESTQWSDKFTEDDYIQLIKKLFNEKITISDDISKMPSVEKTKIEYLGNIK